MSSWFSKRFSRSLSTLTRISCSIFTFRLMTIGSFGASTPTLGLQPRARSRTSEAARTTSPIRGHSTPEAALDHLGHAGDGAARAEQGGEVRLDLHVELDRAAALVAGVLPVDLEA